MYIEQIRNIANWEYCKSEQLKEDEVLYQFGWKDGFHFYLTDYFIPNEFGQFYLIACLDKKFISSKFFTQFYDIEFHIVHLLEKFQIKQ